MTHEQSDFWAEIAVQLLRLEVYVATPELLTAMPVFDRMHGAGEIHGLAMDCCKANDISLVELPANQ